MLTASFNQQNFRFRTVNPLTAAANAAFSGSDPALNANLTSFDASTNAVFRIRFEIEETAGGGENVTWNLYCSRNGGAFFVVNNLSTIVRTSDNPNYADDTATTNLIAGSARAFLAGYADDSDAVMPNSGNQAWTGNQHTELDIACTILSADVANGDTLDFQIRKTGGTTITYTRTPRITVAKSAPTVHDLTGSLSGTGTLSGTLEIVTPAQELTGSISGTGTLSGDLGLRRVLSGSIAGAGTLAGTLTIVGTGFDPADLSVTINGTTAELSWTASGTPGVADYQVFRRTPQTGAAFDPETDTPVATGITGTTHDDTGLDPGDYDWQVFGRVPA